MFDIGFLELVLLSIIGLLVLGPERMPHAVRWLGRAFGKLRRTVRDFNEQINTQLEIEDLRESLKETRDDLNVNRELHDVKQMLSSTREDLEQVTSKVESKDFTAENSPIRKVANV